MAHLRTPVGLSFGLGAVFSLSGVGLRCSSAAASLQAVLRTELDGIRDAGTWKGERVITTPQGASIRVVERDEAVLNFCANNYLGLSVRAERAARAQSGRGSVFPYARTHVHTPAVSSRGDRSR